MMTQEQSNYLRTMKGSSIEMVRNELKRLEPLNPIEYVFIDDFLLLTSRLKEEDFVKAKQDTANFYFDTGE